MTIKNIKLYSVEIPLSEPFYPTWIPGFPQMHNRFYLIELITDTGISGFSASPRFATEGKSAVETLGAFLLGKDPLDIETILDVFQSATYLGMRLYWIEPALWDIKAKIAGLSLFKLLGGKEKKIKSYASTGELISHGKRIERVLAFKEQGFKAVKLRVHSNDIKKDIEIVKKVRENIGNTMDIMVDANQAWRVSIFKKAFVWDRKTALYFAEAMEELDVYWLEEPLDMHDYKGLSFLRSRTTVRIAGGELNFGIHEFRDFVKQHSLDILQPDATISGGITLSRNVAALASINNIGFSPHTWTNGIGLLINLAALGSFDGDKILEYPIDPPGWIPETRDGILETPVLIDKNGDIPVPEEPGIGLKIDKDKLKKFGEIVFQI